MAQPAAEILDHTGKLIRLSDCQRGRRVSARMDAAQTVPDNRNHWAMADGLSAAAANSLAVRSQIRNRARYEVANNSYARGIVLTLANDCIGTGPRLQMTHPDAHRNGDTAKMRYLFDRIENDWQEWSDACCLAQKLHTARMAKLTDGESFFVLANNPRRTGISLDLRLIECDRVTSGWKSVDDTENDGIRYDAFGNPLAYWILDHHPGSTGFSARPERGAYYPAEIVHHWFRMDRPEQLRGLSEIAPALGLFADLRRYCKAVLAAAEAAADFAGIIYSDSVAPGEEAVVSPMDEIELTRNMLLTLPGGWKMDQLDPKQPTANHKTTVEMYICEIARCLLIPLNVAMGNSAGYNYASGRLDHQTYYKAIRVERAGLERYHLGPIGREWLREWALVNRAEIPPETGMSWFWDGTEHVDPAKEATAQATRLESRTTTLAQEYARTGQDWEAQLDQYYAERQRIAEKELEIAKIRAQTAQLLKDTANGE